MPFFGLAALVWSVWSLLEIPACSITDFPELSAASAAGAACWNSQAPKLWDKYSDSLEGPWRLHDGREAGERRIIIT